MKTKAYLLLLSIFFTLFSVDVAGSNFYRWSDQNPESLVIKKNKSEKIVLIQSGEKIKLWLTHKNHEVGYLKSVNENTLIILSNGIEKIIEIKNIKKIKTYSGKTEQVIGGILTSVGIGLMVLGGVSLMAGTLAYIAGELGAIVLVAVPFLGGTGFGIFKAGNRIQGQKLDLKNKWHIVGYP